MVGFFVARARSAATTPVVNGAIAGCMGGMLNKDPGLTSSVRRTVWSPGRYGGQRESSPEVVCFHNGAACRRLFDS